MIFDVPPRSGLVVAAQEMTDTPCQLRQAGCPSDRTQPNTVAHEQVENRYRVGTQPFASDPSFVKTCRTASCKPQESIPAANLDNCMWPGPSATDQPDRSIRKRALNRSIIKAAVDAIDDLVKALRKERTRACKAHSLAGQVATPSILWRVHMVNMRPPCPACNAGPGGRIFLISCAIRPGFR